MPKSEIRKPGRVLERAQRKQLKQLADEHGTVAAAAIIGVHTQTYANLVAGLTSHASMVALVQRRLSELTEAAK